MRSPLRIATCIALALGFAAPAAFSQPATYPAKPIRIIVPVPPGGGVDILARAVGQKISEALKVPVIPENKPGASAAVGTDLLAKSAPDGYTIMMAYTAHATNPYLNPNLPYDTARDFSAVALVGYIPLVLVVHPAVPAQSLRELIALAKAKPGQLSYASGGAGAGAHLSGELFRHLADVDVTHIPYKGNAPALVDLLGGQVTMMFDTVNTALPHVKTGKLKLLATTTPKRSSLAPETPTLIEEGLAGFEVSAWYAVLAPAKTPRDVVARLNAEINKALSEPEMKARFAAQGVEFVGGTPEQAEAFVRGESARWQKIIKSTQMKAD
jgi:tripartite-type tricarboxylate transporter receptor subunit TctC